MNFDSSYAVPEALGRGRKPQPNSRIHAAACLRHLPINPLRQHHGCRGRVSISHQINAYFRSVLNLAPAHTRIESTWDLWPLAAKTAKEPTSRSLVLVFRRSNRTYVRTIWNEQAADAQSMALRFFVALDRNIEPTASGQGVFWR